MLLRKVKSLQNKTSEPVVLPFFIVLFYKKELLSIITPIKKIEIMISTENLKKFIETTKAHLFFNEDNLDQIKEQFFLVIDKNEEKFKQFEAVLPSLKEAYNADLKFFMESDPAADSEEEIILAYPGYKAISCYRIAHEIYKLGYKLQARMITEGAHSITGIDIHPAAQLASPLFIDHGTGIVVGETTITGKNVKIYQGVTLGALSLKDGSKIKGVKRHPTIGNNVIIYAGASILGDVSIGDDVTIGSNVFITESIPDNVKVTFSKPSLVITENKK